MAAKGRISIMPGSGVNENNLDELILKTGAVEFHTTAKSFIPNNSNNPEYNRELTNLEKVKAQTIAQLYKNRWVIEVFFKQLKQNFELKYFLADSENGIKSQI